MRTCDVFGAVALVFGLLAPTGCSGGPSDEDLETSVEQAIAAATDLAADQLVVVVEDGVVTVSGSVDCEECGGRNTPGGLGTVQQTLGALVRAVPGVERVEFALDPPSDG